MAQRFDARTLQLSGDRFPIADEPEFDDVDAEIVASASTNGRMLVPVIRPAISQLEWFDRTGASHGVIDLPPGDWSLRALSPDQHLAVATSLQKLWLVD